MNANENTSTIAHEEAVLLVLAANTLVDNFVEETGQPANSAEVLYSALTVAADNIPAMASVRLVITAKGYSIEYNADLITHDHVLENFRRGMEILNDDMLDNY